MSGLSERSSDSDVSDAAADLQAESAANYIDRNVPQKQLRIGRIFRIHLSAKLTLTGKISFDQIFLTFWTTSGGNLHADVNRLINR